MHPRNAFTMIELLIVISVIGVLAGVALAVINPRRSQNIAEDGVRISNLEKVVHGIETYAAAESNYPTGEGDPSGDSVISHYLNVWPDTGVAGQVYYYATQAVSGTNYVCISVPMATVNTQFFKYVSPHDASVTGGQAVCAGRVLKGCDNSGCPDYDISGCELMNDTSCL